MTQYRQHQTKVSVAKETTWGTGVTPTVPVEVTDVQDTPTAEILLDEGFRGVAASIFDAQQGGKHGEISLEGFVYPEAIAHLVQGMMGSTTTTGAGPYTHAQKAAATPPSYTFEVDRASGGTNGALRYTGARETSLGFTFDASGVLRFSSTWLTKFPTKVTAAATTLDETDNQSFAGWRGTVTSTGLTSNLISAEFNFEREGQVVHTAQNSQDPYAINLGPIRATGRLVVALTDMTLFDTWSAFTEQSFQITFTYGAAAGVRTFTILSTQCNLAGGPFETDRGQIGLAVTLPILMLHNATDGGPAVLTVVNGQTTI